MLGKEAQPLVRQSPHSHQAQEGNRMAHGSELLRFCRPIIHLSGDNETDFYRDNRKKESTDHESPARFKSWLCHFKSICPFQVI